MKKNFSLVILILLSVLRNDYAKKEETPSSSDEATSTEIDEINRNERIARKRYYQKMDRNALPNVFLFLNCNCQ